MAGEIVSLILILYCVVFLSYVGRGGRSKGLSRTRMLGSSDVASAVRSTQRPRT